MKKPKGIKILAIIILVIAALGILNFLPNLIKLLLTPDIVISRYTRLGLNPALTIIQGIVGFLLQLSALISTIIVLQNKGWGRKLLCITTGVMVIIAIPNTVLSLSQSLGFMVIAIISNLFVVCFYGYSCWYFSRKEIKKSFA